MKRRGIRFLVSLIVLLCSGVWTITRAQNVSVPVGLVRDYNLTKEELKVARDSVFLLNAEKVMWQDSASYYKGRYVREVKRKKHWRLVAVVFIVREGINVWLRRMGSQFSI